MRPAREEHREAAAVAQPTPQSRHRFRPALLSLAVGLAFAPSAFAQDAEERIRQLEQQLNAVTQELRSLKDEVRKANGESRPVAPEAAASAPSAAPAPSAAEARALRKDVDQLKTQVAEVKEQATNNEKALDQTGVRAYLGNGLVFEDPRGRWRMNVSGRAQTDFRHFSPDASSADTFTLRRARIGVDATILKDYRVFVEEEFANQATGPAANNAPIMTFAFADLNWFTPGLRFRVGQFKPFIGLDNTMLDLQTDFLERAFTQNLFQNLIYDRGIMAFGQPIPGLVYSASVTNGTGQNADELQGNLREAESDGKEISTRLVGNFAQFFDIPDTVLHFGGSFKHGSNPNSKSNPYRAATVQTEARGITFFIPESFNATTGATNVSPIDRSIFDIEWAVAHKWAKLQGDYAQVRYEGTKQAGAGAPDDFSRTLKAWYVTAGVMLSGEYYADIYRDGAFVRPRPNNNFVLGDKGWGLWELSFRYSSFDGSDFDNGNLANTGRPIQAGAPFASFPNITRGTNKATAYTLGLKWQPIMYLRFMANLIHTKFDTPVVVNGKATDYENALTMRAQLDF